MEIVFYVTRFLHAPCCCFMWGVSLTCPMLFYVGSFSYTLRAVLWGKFLLHAPCCFMWGDSRTRSMLFYVGSFFYMAHAVLCGEFLFHTPCCFMWVFLLDYKCLFLCRKFLFHALCYLISGICLTHPIQVYVGRFSNSMPCALSCEEFHLYSPCCFMREISLTILRAIY